MCFSRLCRPLSPHPVKDAALLMMQRREAQRNVFPLEGSQPGGRIKVCLSVLFHSARSEKREPAVVRRLDTVSLTSYYVVFAAGEISLWNTAGVATLNYVVCRGSNIWMLISALMWGKQISVGRRVHRDFSCMSPRAESASV